MIRFFCTLVFFPLFVFCSWGDLFSDLSDPVENHHVNVITGRLQLSFVDHEVRSPVLLSLRRSYSSSGGPKDAHSRWQFTKGWSFFPYTNLIVDGDRAEIVESNGRQIFYHRSHEDFRGVTYKTKIDPEQRSEITSYRSNVANNVLIFDTRKQTALLTLADGTRRIYKGKPKRIKDKLNLFWSGISHEYLLQEETSTSGQKTVYTYKDEVNELLIQKMNVSKTKTFASLRLRQIKRGKQVTIEVISSDRNTVAYNGTKTKRHLYLENMCRCSGIRESFGYKKIGKRVIDSLDTIAISNRNCLYVVYHEKNDKVRDLFEGGVKVANFTYEPNVTIVKSSDGALTYYHHEKGALTSIESFDSDKNLFSTERFIWEGGNLVARVICDSSGKGVCSKTFAYDSDKNLIKETVYGSITSVTENGFFVEDNGVLEGAESYYKNYKYNKNHLLMEEEEGSGLTYKYDYLDNTDLLICKKTFDGESLLFTESYKYDRDRLLVEKKCEDGFVESKEWYTRDPVTGMIIGSDDGLQKVYYKYDRNNQMIEEGNAAALISHEYDFCGRLICKKYPCGGMDRYEYDRFGNVVKLKQVGLPWKVIEYDRLNRPVSCEMAGRKSTNTYDDDGRITSEVDYKGGVTTFAYDSFGRCNKKTLPAVKDENGEIFIPEYIYKHDLLGRVIYEKDPLGAELVHGYNILGKLLYTVFPDGNKISNTYNLQGNLNESVDRNGVKTTYEYDVQNRLLLKRQGGLEERWHYQGAFLKWTKNQAGLVTIYDYDQYGRKILENCEGRIKEFYYDELGRVSEEKDEVFSNRAVYDVEGRVIETNQNGFNKIAYEYDQENRRTKAIKLTSSGESVDQFFYDISGRIIFHIDPLDEETKFLYEDYARTVIDPLGNRSIERFDALFRVVEKEKQSPDGETLLLEKFCYDRGGNLKKRLLEEYGREVEYDYDIMGNLLQEVESGKKTTSYEYDHKGRQSKKVNADGVFFTYFYDDLDRMIEMKSSDGSVWVEYIFEGVQLAQIKDHVLQRSITYTYTKFGEICEETGLCGFKTSWIYDKGGRTKRIYLPDNSSIRYSYEGSCMNKVSRFDSAGDFLYEHIYEEYDSCRQVKKEQLLGNLGAITTQRDILERPYHMDSLYHSQSLEYNPKSFVIERKDSFKGNTIYKYDALDQLTQEGEARYEFDSLGNPKEYEINDLNQITSTQTENFSYDLKGNLIERKGIKYDYDALNRLKEISYANGKRVLFTYDPLSRLAFKEVWQQGCLELRKFYLYDKELEIGSMNEKGEIQELKVLGLGIQADVGGAISLELQGEVFVPLHDLQGNIVAIVNARGELVEVYDYNAFGEEKSYCFINPWRFASKRVEEELLFFGFRFYDPTIKRWICPDPLGFSESRNLYLYVLNNPVNRLDLFGLESSFHMSISELNALQYTMGQYAANQEPVQNTMVTMFGDGSFNGEWSKMSVTFPVKTDFTYSDKELKSGYINFMDHIPKLTEGCKDKLAFVTFINGVSVTENDFIEMGEGLSREFPKGTLFIGVYNETFGVVKDMFRACLEILGVTTKSTRILQCLNVSLLDIMEKHNPEAYYLHIGHSEGGLITRRAYDKMKDENQRKMSKYVAALGVAGALSIKEESAKFSLNMYSMLDFVTGGLGLCSSSGCNTKILKPISPCHQRMFGIIEHGFFIDTYKNERKRFINKCQNERGGIHEIRQR